MKKSCGLDCPFRHPSTINCLSKDRGDRPNCNLPWCCDVKLRQVSYNISTVGSSIQLRINAWSQPASIVVLVRCARTWAWEKSAYPAIMKLCRVAIALSHSSRQFLLYNKLLFVPEKKRRRVEKFDIACIHRTL